ncbi:MAG: hypothetical protein J2P25_19705 [Nocardiopsaceae bacterium]|nr:hypothetical protein [Nocardiopsaceae bacterium]
MSAESDVPADCAERQQLVDEAVHSGEMEGLHVTAETLADADDYVAGHIDSDTLAERVRERYGLV